MPEHKDLRGDDLHPPPAAYICGIQYRDVQLTNAQILSLFSTPVEAIPAPGAGNQILVLAAYWLADFSAAGYGNTGSDPGQFASVQLVADPTGNFDYVTLGSDDFNNPFAQNRTMWWTDLPVATTNASSPSPFSPVNPVMFNAGVSHWENQPLVIGLNSPQAGGDLTGGNPANTLSVRIWYSIVPVAPFGAA
jgi:hypothetical protein